MPLVGVADGRIGYDSAGTGQVVVLAHADLMDRRMWQVEIDALSDQYRVIAWDRFGSVNPNPASQDRPGRTCGRSWMRCTFTVRCWSVVRWVLGIAWMRRSCVPTECKGLSR